MREIDTDAQVVWPAWCYSGNSEDSTLNGIGRKGDIDSEILPEIEAEQPADAQNNGKSKSLNSRRHRSRKEPGAPREAVTGEKSNFLQQQKQQKQQQQQQGVVQSLPSFVLNKFQSSDKMLSDRMVIGFNAVDNNKKHCDNPTTNLFPDKVKNEAQMDSAKNGELGNNNNNNNSANSVNNSSSNNNSIKRERLSPPTNGDVQSSISRSRSATPSSFPGTPPQPTNPNEPLVGQSMPTSTLSAVQARASEFQARNYSDFMRSLAAKYNNPSDSNNQRSMLFEAAKFASSKSSVKESPSPPDIKRPNLPNLTPPQAPQVSNNPFVSSLLSSLPFSPAVFPPLIDMSSTQALVTLARAAKEAEIQNILRSAQKRPNTMQRRSPSSRASLTPTPQQSAQFPVQPFILPTQFHQAQLQARQTSPVGNTSAAPSTDFTTTSPLDLSSNPHAKRLKLEPTDRSRSSSPARDPLTSGKLAKSECAGSGGGGGDTEIQASTSPRGLSSNISRHCQAQSEEINSWTVDDVGEFVGSIDICAEYVKNFREQCIDGSGLPLLTEEHLTNSLGMKLGPALKLRSILAKKLGGPCPCVSCTTLSHQSHLTAAAVASVPSSSSSSSSSSSLGTHNQTTSNTASVNQSSSCSNIPRPASADSGS